MTFNNKTKIQDIPQWISTAGAIIGIMTLLFFMLLILMVVTIEDIDIVKAYSLIPIVLAVGIAISTSFIGGTAAAKGNIPIPFIKEYPMTFSVSGGIAVFFLTLMIENNMISKIESNTKIIGNNIMNKVENNAGKKERNNYHFKIRELKKEVSALRGNWEVVHKFNSSIIADKIQEGKSIAEALYSIPDEKINLGYKIEKYRYTGYAYIIVAEMLEKGSYKEILNKALFMLEEAQKYINQAKQERNGNASNNDEITYYKELDNHIRNDKVREGILYLKAIGYGIAIRNGDTDYKKKLEKIINELENEYGTYISDYKVKAAINSLIKGTENERE